jgi:DNA-binding ferritin-like protein
MNNKKTLSEEMTKAEIKELVKDVIDSELKDRIKDGKLTDEEKVRDIIKALLKKHYKTLWMKANYFIEEL